MIWAASVVGVLGFIFMAIGIPAVNAKISEISISTGNDIRQDAEIKHLAKDVNTIELAIAELTAMNVAIARIETKLETWEPDNE